MLGRLFAETIEHMDMAPIDALTLTGARRVQVFTHGIVPSILPSLLGIALYRLDENIRSSLVLGFVGVLVIMRPGSERIDANLLILLLSAATGAMNNITVKFLARTERPSTIVAFFMIYLTPLSLIPALFVWRWPDLWTFGALVGLGCLGTIAHISVARALATADASACAPFEFARLPFAALIGFLWFGEVTDLWTWVGAAIIAGSSVYVAHREARFARLARRREPCAPALSPRSSYGQIATGE